MKLIKTYVRPTDLYVSGACITQSIEDEEFSVQITDDYCSGQVKGNKNTDFWMETEGSMTVLTHEQLVKALNDYKEAYSEDMHIVKFEAFTGDVYVRLLNQKNQDCLKEDATLEGFVSDECIPELDDNEWLEVELLFSGNYTSSNRKELSDYNYLVNDNN